MEKCGAAGDWQLLAAFLDCSVIYTLLTRTQLEIICPIYV